MAQRDNRHIDTVVGYLKGAFPARYARLPVQPTTPLAPDEVYVLLMYYY
jgi:hypothetical protein